MSLKRTIRKCLPDGLVQWLKATFPGISGTNTPPLPICAPPTRILEREGDRVLCEVGDTLWRLDTSQYLDNEIIQRGVFESESTALVMDYVKPGMIVVDVGANIGYYTVKCSRLVGEKGRVYAFEPTSRYRSRLEEHLQMNKCKNVTVLPWGLSDCEGSLDIALGGDSATLHWCDDRKTPLGHERIEVRTLDGAARDLGITRIDFVKVDIDGHEVKFLDGACGTLRKMRPIVLMEFMQLALMKSGADVPLLRKKLLELDYVLFSEKTKKPFASETAFLVETMNCAYSANVLCLPREHS